MAKGSVGLTAHDESRDALGHPTVGGGVHGCPLLSVLAGDEGKGKHRSSWDHGKVTGGIRDTAVTGPTTTDTATGGRQVRKAPGFFLPIIPSAFHFL